MHEIERQAVNQFIHSARREPISIAGSKKA